MYNFVKDELNLAKYKYKGEKEETFGFIAQDIQNTKLGKVIIHEDSNEMLSYDTGAYMNTIAGALQKAIEKIEILEARIKELEEN